MTILYLVYCAVATLFSMTQYLVDIVTLLLLNGIARLLAIGKKLGSAPAGDSPPVFWSNKCWMYRCGMTISLFGLLCCCHTVYYVSLLGRHSYFIIIIVYTDVVWPYCSFWSSVQLPHCFGLLCCLTNCTIWIERLWTAPEKFQAPSPPTRVPLYIRHWRGDPFLPCNVSVDTMAVSKRNRP